MRHSALAVDADELNCKVLKLALELCNCHAVCSRSLQDAASLLQQRRFDIVVQDWNFPGNPGELCQLVRSREDPCLFVIVGAPYLRRKLGPSRRRLETVRGVGYRWIG